MSFRDDAEFQSISQLLYRQAQSTDNAVVAAVILEVRGHFTGHTPREELDFLAKKIM